MKNEDLDNYYTTVLAAAYTNIEFIDLAGEAPRDDIVANAGALAGFNKIAFLEDVKAFTKVIVDRRASDIKFDTPNHNEISNETSND